MAEEESGTEKPQEITDRTSAGKFLLGAVMTLFGAIVTAQSSTPKFVWVLICLVAGVLALVGLWLFVTGTHVRRPPSPPQPATSELRLPSDGAEESPRIQAYLKQITQGYQDGYGHREWLVTAPLGYGKTSLLTALAKHFRDSATVVWISIPSSAGYTVDRSCLNMVDALAYDLAGVDPTLQRRLMGAIRKADTRLGEGAGPEALTELAKTTSDALSDTGRTIVLIVDDVHHVPDPQAVDWLLRLGRSVIGRGRALVVLAAQASQTSTTTVAGGLSLVAIHGGQSEAETRWRLARTRRVPKDGIPAASQRILEVTGGMCFAFDWLSRQVAAEGFRALDRVRGGGSADIRVSTAATAALEELDRAAADLAGVPALRLADWLAVLDRFGGGYLSRVLEEILEEEEHLSTDQADRIVAWLSDGHPEIQPFNDDARLGFHLVPFLQEFRRGQLRSAEPHRLENFRAVVERKYWRLIVTDATVPANVQLMRMTRWETPEWHTLTMEWLDHAQGAGPRAFHDVTRSCVYLFLSMYSWWDCVVPSAYCEQLVRAYEQRWPNATWVTDLRRFRENYVSGSLFASHHPATEHPRWAQVETVLANLTTRLGLSSADGSDPNVYDLIAIFRAIACRFRGHHDESVTWLDKAQAAGPETWILPWLTFHRADTLLAAGRLDEARVLADQVAAEALAIKDNDLMIVIAQFLSDLASAAGDSEQAVGYMVRSVLWAHAYHLQQETDGVTEPSTPDSFSKYRHEEANRLLRKRLDELDKTLRAALENQITEFFAPYWNHMKTKATGPVRTLLPPPPTAEDTYKGTESSYFEDVRDMYFDVSRPPERSMRGRLAELLDAPLG